MGYFRFRRSISIIPGVRLNFGKRGVSVSAGTRGAHVTVGKTGVRTTLGVPGTGLSYTTHRKFGQSSPPNLPAPDKTTPNVIWEITKVLIICAVGLIVLISSLLALTESNQKPRQEIAAAPANNTTSATPSPSDAPAMPSYNIHREPISNDFKGAKSPVRVIPIVLSDQNEKSAPPPDPASVALSQSNPTTGNIPRDILTTDGHLYKNAIVTAHDAIGITIKWDDGIARLKFSELPDDIRQQYGYDPIAAKQLENAEYAAQFQQNTSPYQPSPTPYSVPYQPSAPYQSTDAPSSYYKDVYVHGYYRKNGTYVNSYYRSR